MEAAVVHGIEDLFTSFIQYRRRKYNYKQNQVQVQVQLFNTAAANTSTNRARGAIPRRCTSRIPLRSSRWERHKYTSKIQRASTSTITSTATGKIVVSIGLKVHKYAIFYYHLSQKAIWVCNKARFFIKDITFGFMIQIPLINWPRSISCNLFKANATTTNVGYSQ